MPDEKATMPLAIMRFEEKLKELRKARGLTQEELADAIYVSRPAVSKWESGRGYPSIESLRALADYFVVSIDELLSASEMATISDDLDHKRKKRVLDVSFGLLGLVPLTLLFLPFFGYEIDETIVACSLVNLVNEPYIIVPFYILIIMSGVLGLLVLSLQRVRIKYWDRIRSIASLSLAVLMVLAFGLTRQPYPMVMALLILLLEGFLLYKFK